MTTPVFPALPGLGWPVVKTPQWSTLAAQGLSGRQTRAAPQRWPRYIFELVFNFLSDADSDALLGLYLSSKGAFGSFFFDAGAGDNAADQAPIGIGDGITKTWRLYKDTGGEATEPVAGTHGACTAYVNGVGKAAMFAGDGTVTFTTAPASGTALTWSGNYYYRCHFKEDSYDFERLAADLSDLQSLTLESEPAPVTV